MSLSPSIQRKLSSKWSRLKRRLSSDHTHSGTHGEPSTHAFESTEILPDDLEYIEGGDIVQEHLPHHVESNASQSESRESNQPSKHSLFPVEEERGDNTNENSATDGGTVTKFPEMAKNEVKSTQDMTSNADSTEPVLPRVCGDKMF